MQTPSTGRPRHERIRPGLLAIATAALVALAVSSCRPASEGPAIPTPAGPQGLATVAPLASDTQVPPGLSLAPEPSDLATEAAREAAMPAVTARPLGIPTVPTPTVLPGVLFDPLAGDGAEGTGSCAVLRDHESWTLAPADDAPAEAKAAWQASPIAQLLVEAAEVDQEGRRAMLRAIEPPADYAYVLTSTGPLPALGAGGRYRITYGQDVPGTPPVGSGLIVSDDTGPIFVGISLRETDGASARLLGGNRGGFSARQAASRCASSVTTPCGYALRAADAEFADGDKWVAAAAGQPGPTIHLGANSFRVTVLGSHVRQWLGDIPCQDPTDWVLSYRIERQP